MQPLLRENSPGNRLICIVSLLAILMLATSGLWGVVETSEARYSEIAREMLRSGDWLHPRLMDIYHYHKPPLTYWVTAASFSIFGVNSFAARFFLTVAWCIQVFLVFRIARMLFKKDEQVAYFAALIYATSPIVLISVRGLTTDAYLTTFILLAIYAWIKFLDTAKVRFLYAMAAATGLGFLTKGPVVLVLPVFAIIGLSTWYPRPFPGMGKIALGVLLFLGIAFWWFIFLTLEDARFADYFFFRHVVDRIAHAEVFARAEPWYYYLPLIPAIYIPWIAVLLLRKGERSERATEFRRLVIRLALWWFLAPLVLFSLFTSKLILYILPLSIGFSLVAAWLLASRIDSGPLWIFFSLIVIVYLGLSVAPFSASGFTRTPALLILPPVALILSVGTLFFKLTRASIVSLWSFLFAATLILYASLFFRANSLEVNAITPIASFIKEKGMRDRDIMVYAALLPSLSFELDKDIISVYQEGASFKRETQFQGNDQWKSLLIDMSGEEGWTKVKSVLSEKTVLISKHKLPEKVESVVRGGWQEKKFGRWIVYYN